MVSLIEWLENISEKDTKVRAVLRRSFAFDPGHFVPAYPYIEPFIKDDVNSWRREVYYLVAGLWAAHWRQGRSGAPMRIGNAAAHHQKTSSSTSTEKRFISLLDADSDQLPHRLRQMVALLKDETIDFEDLLKGILFWKDDRKRTQNSWARDFYRTLNHETDIEN